jgi:hypothetical protein
MNPTPLLAVRPTSVRSVMKGIQHTSWVKKKARQILVSIVMDNAEVPKKDTGDSHVDDMYTRNKGRQRNAFRNSGSIRAKNFGLMLARGKTGAVVPRSMSMPPSCLLSLLKRSWHIVVKDLMDLDIVF